MLRSLLIKTASYAKTVEVPDRAIRYNGYLLHGIKRKLGSADLTRRIVGAALQTMYGRNYGTDLRNWPVLGKNRVLAASEQFINRSVLLRLPASTGGTTGQPLRLWRSLESVAAEQMFLDELLTPFGVSMEASRMAVLRGGNIKPVADTAAPFGRLSHVGRRLALSTVHLNSQTVEWFYQALQEFQPEILWVYPNTALNLMQLLSQANLRLSVPVILSSSETMSPTLHKTLEEYFGGKVINYYGQAERACLAYSTNPETFYFNPRYGKVELKQVDPQTAQIIATGYWNNAMPLIRYNTGDLALLPGACEESWLDDIAAGLRPFPGILGRDDEYLLTREGLRITGLNQVAREIQNILQLQFVQTDADLLAVNVIAKEGFGKNDVADIIEQTRLKVPASMDIKVRVVSKPATGKNGKTPLILRNFKLP